MGYTISKNQKGVKKGFVRYRFDTTTLTGKRERKQIVCQVSVVNTLYRKWENELLEYSSGKFKFFEKLDEYLEHCKDYKSEGRWLFEKSIIENVVKVFFKKDVLINDIKRSHANDFIDWRKKFTTPYSYKQGYISNSTLNHTISVMNCFFKYFIRKEYTNFNPFSQSKVKENNIREIYLTNGQINELVEQAYNLDKKLCAVILLALLSGMRRGEIFSLVWSEVDFDNSVIRLSASKTKSRKRRMIPITPYLKEILISLKANNESEHVVSDFTMEMLKKRWDKLRNKLSFGYINDGSPLRFHDLRHIYSQTLLNKGIGLEDIQSLLGHQSIETTQKRYAMFARPDLLEKASKIDEVIQFKTIN